MEKFTNKGVHDSGSVGCIWKLCVSPDGEIERAWRGAAIALGEGSPSLGEFLSTITTWGFTVVKNGVAVKLTCMTENPLDSMSDQERLYAGFSPDDDDEKTESEE